MSTVTMFLLKEVFFFHASHKRVTHFILLVFHSQLLSISKVTIMNINTVTYTRFLRDIKCLRLNQPQHEGGRHVALRVTNKVVLLSCYR